MRDRRWVKVYFSADQYNEWRNGNGIVIGYTEEEATRLKRWQKNGIDCGLKTDPINHMTKVDPARVTPIGWSLNGVYVESGRLKDA